VCRSGHRARDDDLACRHGLLLVQRVRIVHDANTRRII
jgi:hypothetical protein